MSIDNINYLNIGFILLALVAALVAPFELFLVAYAVLGPLHYFTEISWLHKRNYFTNKKNDFLVLVAISVIILAMFIFQISFGSLLIWLAFSSALAMVVFEQTRYKVIFGVAALYLGVIGVSSNTFVTLFGYLLPTIIHVFVFTAAFMLYGAMKDGQKTSFLAFMVFVGAAMSFFVYVPHIEYSPSIEVTKSFKDFFAPYLSSLFGLFHIDSLGTQDLFQSELGIAIIRFTVFAYIYHYLNWFSKTSIIKWHLVPRKALASILVLWGISVGLYAYDYRLGFTVLYLLSMTHVLLEFPLNYRSFIGIGNESARVVRPYFSERSLLVKKLP